VEGGDRGERYGGLREGGGQRIDGWDHVR
jgi:hypothetical protein